MAPISAAFTEPTAPSRKYIAGPAAQPSEPPRPWMLKARPSRFGSTEALSSAKSAGWNTRVAEAAQHRDGGKARERMREGEQAQRDAERQQAAGQDRPRAEAVDREARSGLAEARHRVEQRAEKADLLEAQADASRTISNIVTKASW